MSPETALPRIVSALGGRRSGRGDPDHCPLHGDRHASLSVGISSTTGTLLLHCHAGCNPRELIEELKRRDLWPYLSGPPATRNGQHERERERGALDERHRAASYIWTSTVPLALPPGEHYL